MLKLVVEVNGQEQALKIEDARQLYADLGVIFKNDIYGASTARTQTDPLAQTQPVDPAVMPMPTAAPVQSREPVHTSSVPEIEKMVQQAYPTNPGYDASHLNAKVEAAKAEARSRTSGCGSR